MSLIPHPLVSPPDLAENSRRRASFDGVAAFQLAGHQMVMVMVMVMNLDGDGDGDGRHGAGPPLRRGALRGAHGNPDRARTPAWNRVCGAIGSVFSAGRGFGAVLKVFVARSHFIELGTR